MNYVHKVRFQENINLSWKETGAGGGLGDGMGVLWKTSRQRVSELHRAVIFSQHTTNFSPSHPSRPPPTLSGLIQRFQQPIKLLHWEKLTNQKAWNENFDHSPKVVSSWVIYCRSQSPSPSEQSWSRNISESFGTEMLYWGRNQFQLSTMLGQDPAWLARSGHKHRTILHFMI